MEVTLPEQHRPGDAVTRAHDEDHAVGQGAGIVPPVSVTLFAPATGTKVPPQVVDPFGIGDTTRPPAATGLVGWVVDGRLSVNVTLVSATPFGLLSVIVTDDLPPAGIGVEFCGR